MRLKIKYLICFQLYFIIVCELLVSIFHFPSVIRYVLDINIIVLMVICFSKRKQLFLPTASKPFFKYVTALAVASTLVAIVRLVPIGQIVWALRNNYFFVFFAAACTVLLNKEDAEHLLDNFLKLQLFNVFCAIIEYFFLHYRNDFTGGMFGVEQGCNAYLNVYLVFVASYSMAKYMNRKMKFNKFIYYIISSFFLAGLSELKIYYVELALIFLCTIMLCRKGRKTLLIILGGFASFFIGLQVFLSLNSASAGYLYSLENAIQYATRTDFGNGDIRIARLTAITQINEYFFRENPFLKLFGYGFGACEDSVTFSLFNSNFATRYGYLQYRNISSSMLYIETGAIGLICFIIIFLLMFRICGKLQRKFEEKKYNEIIVFVQTFSLMVIFMLWYNSSIRREIAYFSFFLLSVLFIYLKDFEKEELQIFASEKRYSSNKIATVPSKFI